MLFLLNHFSKSTHLIKETSVSLYTKIAINSKNVQHLIFASFTND
jgi:hypothetical protein